MRGRGVEFVRAVKLQSVLQEEDLECPVCKEMPEERGLRVCSNGHVVCEAACLARLEKRECPTCRDGGGMHLIISADDLRLVRLACK